MTSGDTYEDTVKLLAQHANFGLEEGQITLMKQEKVPAMLNSDADFALNPDSGLIDTKPHGHGDVHTLLYQHKLTNRWLAEGIKHVVFFQDTNPLIFRSLPLVLGVSRVNGLKVNSVTVPRKPGEAVGAIMKLKGHREMTINVEYNQLEALLASYGGEAQNEHGYSLYPGNINSLVFELEDYSRVLERTKGSIQEFVNPKYKNKEKTTFKSPTRLECMMQDYPMLLDSSAGVGFTQLERGLCFSAVKNDLPTAQAKFREGLPPECASCCEADLYQLNRRLLSPRVRIQEPKPLELGGMSLPLYPRVYLGPRFGLTRSEVLARVGEGCELAGRCELVVEEDVRLEGLRLNDGERAVVGKEGVAITPARKLAPV